MDFLDHNCIQRVQWEHEMRTNLEDFLALFKTIILEIILIVIVIFFAFESTKEGYFEVH